MDRRVVARQFGATLSGTVGNPLCLAGFFPPCKVAGYGRFGTCLAGWVLYWW